MQPDGLWQAVLGEIEVSISRGNFITWFKNTSLIKQSGGTVVVGVPNIFIKQQLAKKYGDLITETLKNNGLDVKEIEYKIASIPQQRKHAEETAEEPQAVAAVQAVATIEQDVLPVSNGVQPPRPTLNERYTLENFVVGDGNELAFAACQAIAQRSGTRYNPLFLYGGVGIGKTHLIQAVGNALRTRDPAAQILYISTEQFVQEFVSALRNRKTGEFSAYYRGADVLIVDDIQFIAGKEKMQEEFFHTFNTLHQTNKQVIISSDRPPGEIPTLEDRLKSRLAGGMSIDMQIPDFETRCAIIQTKAQTHNAVIEQDIVEYLASNIQTNIRELEAALNQLLAFCEMRGIEPTLAIATSQLTINRARPKHLSAKQIIERTARHFQIPIEDMLGPKRDKDIVVPRQIAMYMLRCELHLSFPKIAKELGRKDHTTAIHSVEKITKESQSDVSLRMAIAEIKEHLYV